MDTTTRATATSYYSTAAFSAWAETGATPLSGFSFTVAFDQGDTRPSNVFDS